MRHINEAKNKLALSGLTDDRFLVMEDMTLETRQGDAKFLMGEEVILGADGDKLVVQDPCKTYVVEDQGVGLELINNVVCKEELSDVKYKKLTFLEAKSMRVVTSDLIKAVADTDEIRDALKDAKKRKESLFEMKKTGVDLPVVMNEHKLSLEDKLAKIFANKIQPNDAFLVEAVEIRENPAFAKDMLMLDNIKVLMDEAKKDHKNVDSADDFMAAANDIDGASVDMLPAEDGEEGGEMVAKQGEEVLGYFDTKNNVGVIFKVGAFKDVKELKAAMKDAGITLKSKVDLDALIDAGKDNEVEEAINNYMNSEKTEECFNECKKRLCCCGLAEDVAAKVIECFK